MAGYSGTPLPQKLGLKEKFRVAFVDLPGDVKTELKDSLTACRSVLFRIASNSIADANNEIPTKTSPA